MSELRPPLPPTPPPGVPARPFSGDPRPVPGGCSRPLLIGCGVITVLLGLAAIVFVAKAKDLLAWTMRELEESVLAALPAEVTEAEERRLERGFEAAVERIQRGEVEPPALFALQRQLSRAAELAQRKSLAHDDVLDLLSALERVGGLLPADDGSEPEDAGGGAETESRPPPGEP